MAQAHKMLPRMFVEVGCQGGLSGWVCARGAGACVRLSGGCGGRKNRLRVASRCSPPGPVFRPPVPPPAPQRGRIAARPPPPRGRVGVVGVGCRGGFGSVGWWGWLGSVSVSLSCGVWFGSVG